MATIKSIMIDDLLTADPNQTVAEIAKIMSEYKLGAVLIVAEGKLQGIFSERDLLTRVVAQGKNPSTTKLIDVATRNPITVRTETPVKKCVRIIKDNNIRHLPIVDETGTPLGIISSRDFLQYVVKELELFIDKALAQHKFEAGVDAYEHFSGPFVGYRIVSDARRK